MRLLNCGADGGFFDIKSGSRAPFYAILSHLWGSEFDEILYRDILEDRARSKNGTSGYQKLQFCQDWAKLDGLRYIWIDSFCIDKTNAVELQRAINSMFRWYKQATICYAYLSDVSTPTVPDNGNWSPELRDQFCASRWFKRGWTFQELLAPRIVRFYSCEGHYLGDKASLELLIHQATGIDILALRGKPLDRFPVETILSWARDRQTTELEDKAYSLAGLFGLCMTLHYGEGEQAAMDRLRRKAGKSRGNRLLRQIKVGSSSVFSWILGRLADNPQHFVTCRKRLVKCQVHNTWLTYDAQ